MILPGHHIADIADMEATSRTYQASGGLLTRIRYHHAGDIARDGRVAGGLHAEVRRHLRRHGHGVRAAARPRDSRLRRRRHVRLDLLEPSVSRHDQLRRVDREAQRHVLAPLPGVDALVRRPRLGVERAAPAVPHHGATPDAGADRSAHAGQWWYHRAYAVCVPHPSINAKHLAVMMRTVVVHYALRGDPVTLSHGCQAAEGEIFGVLKERSSVC